MMGAEKRTPGQHVSVEEVNYLLTKIRDLRNGVEAARKQLNMLDSRLCALEETVEGFHVDDVVVEPEEEEE